MWGINKVPNGLGQINEAMNVIIDFAYFLCVSGSGFIAAVLLIFDLNGGGGLHVCTYYKMESI